MLRHCLLNLSLQLAQEVDKGVNLLKVLRDNVVFLEYAKASHLSRQALDHAQFLLSVKEQEALLGPDLTRNEEMLSHEGTF